MKNTQCDGVHIYRLDTPMLFSEMTAFAIRREVEGLLATGSFRHLVVDLATTNLVGTPALRLFLRLKARCDQLDRGFGLCGLQPSVREVLCITKLDQVFRIYEDAGEAMEAAGSRQTSVA